VFLESRLRLPCASVSSFRLDDFFEFGFKRCCKFVRYAVENMRLSLNTTGYDVLYDFSTIRGNPVRRIKEPSDGSVGTANLLGPLRLTHPRVAPSAADQRVPRGRAAPLLTRSGSCNFGRGWSRRRIQGNRRGLSDELNSEATDARVLSLGWGLFVIGACRTSCWCDRNTVFYRELMIHTQIP
jgi:hypothetical protein